MKANQYLVKLEFYNVFDADNFDATNNGIAKIVCFF